MMQEAGILKDIATGILYKNPKPHVKSVHAYFPSVTVLPNGEMAASYVLAEAFEAVNARMHLSRSTDGGQTWSHEGAMFPKTTETPLFSEFGRTSIAPNGTMVANLLRCDRSGHPDEGLTNAKNMGFVPTELLISKSSDGGRSWNEPAAIRPPLVGPAFELCTSIAFLRDGRWIWPTSTWLDWEGNLPNGNRMVAFTSSDGGETWPSYLDVMHSPDDSLIFWESKIIELFDGRLVAVAWCFDQKANADRPNHFAVSRDGGRTWTEPRSMDLLGQTLTPCRLPDDRILCVFRRMDQPGLWAAVAHLEGDRWVNDGLQPLWGHRSAEGRTVLEENMVDSFHNLKFGAPCAVALPDGAFFVVFWCYEQNISVIRWFKFHVA